ncbi:MAG: nitroreductase family protein [Candidatus Hodarchaeota archaeon]
METSLQKETGLERTHDLFQIIQQRRSIRKYKPGEIPEADLKKILDAARLAPSAENSQPWRFILVKDQKTKELLAQPTTQSFISKANIIIVVLGDTSTSCCPSAQTWTTHDPMIATEHLVLAATALGYGTCWIANYRSRSKVWIDEVKQVLKIPESMRIVVLVALGIPAENPKPRSRKNLQDISFDEIYGNPKIFH